MQSQTVNSRSAPHGAWTMIIASLGVFMTALDALVVTTALPALRVDLGASLADLEWTVNSYNLAFACLLLTGAALGDRLGRRRTFTVGLGVFTAASALAAIAPTVEALIAARVLQGAGAAIVTPLTLTLISDAFPAEKRGAAIGLWGGISGLAVAAGPVVGGAVVDGIGWQWIFWLNVPVGLALIPLAATKLTESFGPRPQLDIKGLCLAAVGAFGPPGRSCARMARAGGAPRCSARQAPAWHSWGCSSPGRGALATRWFRSSCSATAASRARTR